MTDYDSGGNHFDNGFSRIGGAMFWRSDINHIYGVGSDGVCGDNCENVNMIFPGGCYQPVQDTNGKWRYINVDGNYMSEDEFDDAYPFCYGIARVCKGGRWFYLNSCWRELTIRDNSDRTYKVFQGENFHYDDSLQKVVAKMCLLSPKSNQRSAGAWALVDNDGYIVSFDNEHNE